jgi:hypothetical protein
LPPPDDSEDVNRSQSRTEVPTSQDVLFPHSSDDPYDGSEEEENREMFDPEHSPFVSPDMREAGFSDLEVYAAMTYDGELDDHPMDTQHAILVVSLTICGLSMSVIIDTGSARTFCSPAFATRN